MSQIPPPLVPPQPPKKRLTPQDIRWLVFIGLFFILFLSRPRAAMFWIPLLLLIIGYVMNRWGAVRFRWIAAGFGVLVALGTAIGITAYATSGHGGSSRSGFFHHEDANDRFLDSYEKVVAEWENKNPPLSFDDLNRLAKVEVEMADKVKQAEESQRTMTRAQINRWMDLNARYVKVVERFQQ